MRSPLAGRGQNIPTASILARFLVVVLLCNTITASSRFQFHEQGLHGPHSYKFGYDTGPGHNRMSRHEERDNYGVVRGFYTYHDPKGNMRTVHYEAHPKYGYHVKGDFGNFPRNDH